MIERFEIIGTGSSRPDAGHIVFCDGIEAGMFREESDLELSHWRPNRTPRKYRAGTSTEICFRFLDDPLPGSWTVAVNNHVDMDGILSVFVLTHAQYALKHRESIIRAAEIGDFWGWGEDTAQRLFQGVTQMMSQAEGRTVYEAAFRRIPGLIDGTDPELPEIVSSLKALRSGVEFVEQGQIIRNRIGEQLTHYIVPLSIAGTDDRVASFVPKFNEEISANGILWPQVRARWDAERICLVSIERSGGWFHDLWFPGYLWADTEGLRQVPGMNYHDGMGSYDLQHPHLIAAFESLQDQESGDGLWGLGGTRLPLGKELQRRFPLVGRFSDPVGNAALSVLSPEIVARRISSAFP